jgi:hypothetical protein
VVPPVTSGVPLTYGLTCELTSRLFSSFPASSQSYMPSMCPANNEANDLVVSDAEVVGEDDLLGEVGAVERAVIGAAHDGESMVVEDFSDVDGDVVTHHLVGHPSPDGLDSDELVSGVVHEGVLGEGGHDGVEVVGVYGVMWSATMPVRSIGVMACFLLSQATRLAPGAQDQASLNGRVKVGWVVDSPASGRPQARCMTSPVLSIGDFARATRVSVKMLCHYHRIALL